MIRPGRDGSRARTNGADLKSRLTPGRNVPAGIELSRHTRQPRERTGHPMARSQVAFVVSTLEITTDDPRYSSCARQYVYT
jgi:hypothetical protein